MLAWVLIAVLTSPFPVPGALPVPGSRLPAPGADQEIFDRTLALLGGQAITLSDVRAAAALGLIDDAPSSVAELTSRLVDRELILREVQRYAPPEPAAADVEARLNAIRSRFSGPGALDRLLDQHGFTEARLRAWIRDDLRMQAYLAQRFASAMTAERRQELIVDWLSDLRRRTDVVILQQ